MWISSERNHAAESFHFSGEFRIDAEHLWYKIYQVLN